MDKMTCGNCNNYCESDSFCCAQVPQWVDFQGQHSYVRPDDNASDCVAFLPVAETVND